MADVTPADGPALGGKASASCVGMDQITVVRIDDTHIAEEHSHAGGKGKAVACYEMEYSVPAEEEEEQQQQQQEEEEEEEEDGVYVIEYSNPEEEGESYQFTMSVDRSLPAKRPALKHPAAPESARAPSLTDKPSRRPRQKRKLMEEEEEEEEEKKKQLVSNKREDSRDAAGTTSGSDPRPLVCSLCPPGRSFKRASGLAVHMKHMHLLEGNKTFFCTACKLPVRTQIELDAHTKRHANQRAVFTCRLCPPAAPPGYRGSRLGLRRHLEQEHPGVVPRCDVCSKGFSTLASYLADQFRHVGVSPFFCARCQIYEMTERGLSVHVRNHDKKTKKTKKEEVEKVEKVEEEEAALLLLQEESGGIQPQTSGGADNADNSATDDSDF